MTHIQELLIKNLRFYRNKNNFTQLSFSEKIGVSPNYLNAIENGKNFPSPEVLQKIADELKILPYELFLENVNEKMNSNSQLVEKVLSDVKEGICSFLASYNREEDDVKVASSKIN